MVIQSLWLYMPLYPWLTLHYIFRSSHTVGSGGEGSTFVHGITEEFGVHALFRYVATVFQNVVCELAIAGLEYGF